jgi:hypothetical protein
MTPRTPKRRRNPLVPIAAITLAIAASGLAAAPARADGAFERAFEAELGRIAARELVHVGSHVLRLGHVEARWVRIPRGYRGEWRAERRLGHGDRHHGRWCRREHRGERAYRDRHDRRH